MMTNPFDNFLHNYSTFLGHMHRKYIRINKSCNKLFYFHLIRLRFYGLTLYTLMQRNPKLISKGFEFQSLADISNVLSLEWEFAKTTINRKDLKFLSKSDLEALNAFCIAIQF